MGRPPRSFGPAGQSAIPNASYVASARAVALGAPPLAWFCATKWPDFTLPLTPDGLQMRPSVCGLPWPCATTELVRWQGPSWAYLKDGQRLVSTNDSGRYSAQSRCGKAV
jgi:hypothetical protein